MGQLRSFASRIAPAPVRKLVRTALAWTRPSQFRPYTMIKTIDAESFPFFIGDVTAHQWYGPEKDPVVLELRFIRDHMLSPGDLVFDVGSHHGLHTVFMARRPVRIVAIEPNPHNVSILRRNLALNAAKNVSIHQTAVGDRQCRLNLPQDSNAGGVLLREKGALPIVEVESQSLDQLAHRYGFPDFLKIDVEGFEAQVLRGATEILQRRPKIAIEVHVEWVVRYGSTVNDVAKLLNLESYRVWIQPYDFSLEEVQPWTGADLNNYPPPKFTLFLLPRR